MDRGKQARIKSKKRIEARAVLLSFVLIGAMLPSLVEAQSEINDPVYFVLSSRHMVMDPARLEKLEQLAGGEEKLVAKLLSYREDQGIPFVAYHAEKLLLSYAEREEVRLALEADLENPSRRRLARVIAINLQHVPSSETRQILARKLISRVEGDTGFLPYAKAATLESNDPKVRELGRELLK